VDKDNIEKSLQPHQAVHSVPSPIVQVAKSNRPNGLQA
jgi:hypothetical protein